MPILSKEAVLLFPKDNWWWFAINTNVTYIQTPHQFFKFCKKKAYIFIIIPRLEIPNCVLLGKEEEVKIKGKGGKWPVELIDFKDVMDLSKVAILPYYY